MCLSGYIQSLCFGNKNSLPTELKARYFSHSLKSQLILKEGLGCFSQKHFANLLMILRSSNSESGSRVTMSRVPKCHIHTFGTLPGMGTAPPAGTPFPVWFNWFNQAFAIILHKHHLHQHPKTGIEKERHQTEPKVQFPSSAL